MTFTTPSPTLMTVDEFLAWTEEQPGRYELHDGIVYAMAPERVGHASMKFAVQTALAEAIKARRVPCHVLPDGMTVRAATDAAYEPDALVYCGATLSPSAIEVPNPVIVVEVLSPSTRYLDTGAKLPGYFSIPSVRHYLVVNPDKPMIVHHERGADGTIRTSLVGSGAINLDPPGLALSVDMLYASLE